MQATHTISEKTLDSLRTVKCRPQFNLVDGGLSGGGGLSYTVDRGEIEFILSRLTMSPYPAGSWAEPHP